MKQNHTFIPARLLGIFLILQLFSVLPASAQVNSSDDVALPIPKTFTPEQGILLIQEDANNDSSLVPLTTQDKMRTDVYVKGHINKKAMYEYADKNLSFKHEYASQRTIIDSTGQFADKKLYRFALVIVLIKQEQRLKFQQPADPQHDQPSAFMESTHYQPIFRFHIYDRLTGKTYGELGNGSSIFMWGFKAAIKRIGKPL